MIFLFQIRVMGIGVGALSNTYGTSYIYGTTASAICGFIALSIYIYIFAI